MTPILLICIVLLLIVIHLIIKDKIPSIRKRINRARTINFLKKYRRDFVAYKEKMDIQHEITNKKNYALLSLLASDVIEQIDNLIKRERDEEKNGENKKEIFY